MKNLSWDECIRLSKNPRDLNEMLRARLVELVASDGAVAIRAIEALMALDIEEDMGEFDGITFEQLRSIRERARTIIIEESASKRSATPD